MKFPVPDAQAKAAEIEAAKAALAEAEAAVAELKASFQEDPLSLVPWMQVRRGRCRLRLSGHLLAWELGFRSPPVANLLACHHGRPRFHGALG